MLPFIALEGCDGSGKTTVRNIICRQLEEDGIQCKRIGQHSWLNPRDSRLIVRLRDQKCRPGNAAISSAYASDKFAHGRFNVEPLLGHSVVIADRWIYSDAVYHSVLYGIDMAETLQRHKIQQTILPELVIYVSTTVTEAYKRVISRGRQTRHYERPSDLREISKAYEVLFAGLIGTAERVLRFSNDPSDVNTRVRDFIMPVIRELIDKRAHPTGYE